jgi:hydrogenase assembly chaperone HypC/HupF
MCLAVPGRVLSIADRDGTPFADVDLGGVEREVCLAYLPDVEVGDYVIVHVGFAIQRLDEESARETLALLDELEQQATAGGTRDRSAPRRATPGRTGGPD